jgi:hypothetical protein
VHAPAGERWSGSIRFSGRMLLALRTDKRCLPVRFFRLSGHYQGTGDRMWIDFSANLTYI